MTIWTLNIDDKNQDLLEVFITIASKFKGVSFKIEKEEIETKEVLSSFRQAMKDIKTVISIKQARPIRNMFKEFAND